MAPRDQKYQSNFVEVSTVNPYVRLSDTISPRSSGITKSCTVGMPACSSASVSTRTTMSLHIWKLSTYSSKSSVSVHDQVDCLHVLQLTTCQTRSLTTCANWISCSISTRLVVPFAYYLAQRQNPSRCMLSSTRCSSRERSKRRARTSF